MRIYCYTINRSKENPATIGTRSGVQNNLANRLNALWQAHSKRFAPIKKRGNHMANHLSRDEQIQIVRLLVEGSSLRSITRITGIHRTTIQKLLVSFGESCRSFLDGEMRNLRLNHLQCDEIWTFCRKKQAHLKPEEKDDPSIGDQYLFIAFDEETKLMACYALGKRTKETTEAFAADLAQRIITPDMESDEPKPQISTDGWAAYPGAIDLAFANTVSHGVLIKKYADEQSGRYAPPEVVGTDRSIIQGDIDPFSICTSHVERNNLTIRTFMRRFTRLSLGFSKKLENLAAAVAIHIAYYNFCWRTRQPGTSGKLRPTAAMMANVTDHLWSLDEFFSIVTNYESTI